MDGRPTVVLESPAAKLVIDLGGGSIVDFHFAAGGLNPLRWIGPADENAVLRPMAHFLCLDRWGQPSEAELRNGMPFHGEAARVRWREFDAPEARDGRIIAAMGATLPMAGLEVRRTVRLSEKTAVFSVSETVSNRNKLGRIYNMVQHATIGPPFLDETPRVDSMRSGIPAPSNANPEQPETGTEAQTRAAKSTRHLTSDPDQCRLFRDRWRVWLGHGHKCLEGVTSWIHVANG